MLVYGRTVISLICMVLVLNWKFEFQICSVAPIALLTICLDGWKWMNLNGKLRKKMFSPNLAVLKIKGMEK